MEETGMQTIWGSGREIKSSDTDLCIWKDYQIPSRQLNTWKGSLREETGLELWRWASLAWRCYLTSPGESADPEEIPGLSLGSTKTESLGKERSKGGRLESEQRRRGRQGQCGFMKTKRKRGKKRRDLRRREWSVKAGTTLGSPLYLQGVL